MEGEELLQTIIDLAKIALYVIIGAVIFVKNYDAMKRIKKKFETLKEPEINQAPAPTPAPAPVRATPKVKEETRYFTYENDEDFARARMMHSSPSPEAGAKAAKKNAAPNEKPANREFNLRDAVIYSEILKPKFDE